MFKLHCEYLSVRCIWLYVYFCMLKFIWLYVPNSWVFVYELSGCGFESRCSHFNFRYRACFEQGVPWYSGKFSVWIHSKMSTWHDNDIQSWMLSSNFQLSTTPISFWWDHAAMFLLNVLLFRLTKIQAIIKKNGKLLFSKIISQ